MSERELLRQTAEYAADFLESLGTRPVRPEADVQELTEALGGPLPEAGTFRTTTEDVDRSAAAILAAAAVRA